MPEEGEVVLGGGQMTRYDEMTAITAPFGHPQACFPCYIGAGLYRRSVFDAVGVFEPAMQCAENTDWFAKLQESGRAMLSLLLATSVVRRHSANLAQSRDFVDLGMVRAVKKSLDCRRVRGR